jgi:phosphoglucosamine mutase
VRYSGTEPLARVMVEGREAEQVERLARSIADVIEKELG